MRDKKLFNIPKVSKDKVEKILNAKDVSSLRQMQINGEVTSVEIVAVYSQRCYSIGRKLNLVSEEYYDEALKMAEQKDKELQQAIKNKTTDKLPRLHGIPVSIKDHVRFSFNNKNQIEEKGRITTVGCNHFADHFGPEDATVVRLIKKEGGIPFVKSNNP